ncbi:MAG: peptide deformylase [Candidatus Caldatribacteriaceae bacterium]
MAVRTIEKYGSDVLRKRAERIEHIDGKVLSIVQDMKETMHAFSGVGLAGNQIGILLRVVTLVHPETKEDLALVNPEIVSQSEEKEVGEEGCLSIPEVYAKVERTQRVVVRGFNEKGQEVVLEAEGFLARILQHEIDHLDGILFVDRLSPSRRLLLGNKLKKISRDTGN